MSRFDERLLADLRRANADAFPEPPPSLTFGDLLDVALGGPVRWVCWHCRPDRSCPEHGSCLGGSSGRTCQCTDGPHPLRRRP